MLARLVNDSRGTTSIEYAIIACVISVAAMTGYMSLGGGISGFWGNFVTKVVTALH